MSYVKLVHHKQLIKFIYTESNVKWSAEFPIPDDAKATLPFIERHTARAVAIAMSAPYGPVHLNVPFREPLLIDFCELCRSYVIKQSILNELAPSSEEAKHVLQKLLQKHEKGFIVVGELTIRIQM